MVYIEYDYLFLSVIYSIYNPIFSKLLSKWGNDYLTIYLFIISLWAINLNYS